MQVSMQQDPSRIASSLWQGNIEDWMTESYIQQIWQALGFVVTVKIIRERPQQQSLHPGYCFVEFGSHQLASMVLATYNGQPIPGTNKVFRLNWASGGGVHDIHPSGHSRRAGSTCSNNSSTTSVGAIDAEYSLFVGDLSPEVTDVMLYQLFSSRYGSVKAAKVVTDPITRTSRGYGFVRFNDETEQQIALLEMNGTLCGSRAMRISLATPKSLVRNQAVAAAAAATAAIAAVANSSVHSAPVTNTSTMSSTPTAATPPPPPVSLVSNGCTMRTSGRSTPSVASRNPSPSAMVTPATSGEGCSSDGYDPALDPFNTTIFVGGLIQPISSDDLRTVFSRYGEVTYCKIPASKGCGFVTFALRANAEAALQQLNGYVIGSSRLRLSWGRGLDRVRKNTPPPQQQQQQLPVPSASGPMPVQSTLSLPPTCSQQSTHARTVSSGQIGIGLGAIGLPPPASGPLPSLLMSRRDQHAVPTTQPAIPQLHHSDLSLFQNGVLGSTIAGSIPAMRSSSYNPSDSGIGLPSLASSHHHHHHHHHHNQHNQQSQVQPSVLSGLLHQQHSAKMNLVPRTIGDTFLRQPSPLHDILSFSLPSTTAINSTNTASVVSSSSSITSSSLSSLPSSLLKIDSDSAAANSLLSSFDPFKY